MTRQKTLLYHRYGWRPDKPDHRDLKFKPTGNPLSKVDLRSKFPVAYEQGILGSSSAQAIASLLHFNSINKTPFQPSVLFIYYNARVLGNNPGEDSGAEIRDCIKGIMRFGTCPEQYCPYIVSKFKTKPAQFAYSSIVPHYIESYLRIDQKLFDLKCCLSEGFPFVFGMSVYRSFDSKIGEIEIPDLSERLLGGQAVCCVGYDDNEKVFFIRNSCGFDWGTEGYGTIPYDYVLNENLVSDFWTLRFKF
jgi:C1A family cysteine protease